MNRKDLIEILEMPPESAEAMALRHEADRISRQRFQGKYLLLGQLGIERHACPARCRFCSFSADFFRGEAIMEELDAIVRQAADFAVSGNLGALFLMTMHDFDKERLLKVAEAVRLALPARTKLVLNIGDSTTTDWHEYASAGVSGAYHVLRLREGRDTELSPEARKRTIEGIRKAGLDWYYCCEPVGPEHDAAELAEVIELGNQFGCFQHAAMARVNFPGSPLAQYGEISKKRLAQIVAAVTLASTENPELGSIAVHEPDIDSLVSGANSVYAEAGINPRDLARDTAAGRGQSAQELTAMLTLGGWETPA